MSEITYDDKVDLQVATNIANINKVTASDMNEIKNVVNGNANEVGDITSLTTTDKTSVVNAVNELNTNKLETSAIVNEASTETDEVYSSNYLNDKLVSVGTTAPTDGRRVWFAKGKNLFDGKLELGGYGSTGAKVDATNNYRNVNMIPVKPNTTYTFSINGVSQKYVLYFYNIDHTFVSQNSSLTTGTFTTPSNTYFVNFRTFVADFVSDFANLKVQLEQGSIATAYEQYVNPSINVDEEEWYNPNNIEKYSTNEIKIGTWTDGKPIYRSVFDINTISSSNANLVDLNNLNINFIINLRGTIKDTNNYEYPIPLSDSSSNYNVVFYNGRYIRGRCSIGSGASVAIAKVILEYTKTTD